MFPHKATPVFLVSLVVVVMSAQQEKSLSIIQTAPLCRTLGKGNIKDLMEKGFIKVKRLASDFFQRRGEK